MIILLSIVCVGGINVDEIVVLIYNLFIYIKKNKLCCIKLEVFIDVL